MRSYYTRACNFYHGRAARRLIKLNKAFPLNGKKNIAFDQLEIFSREKRKVKDEKSRNDEYNSASALH